MPDIRQLYEKDFLGQWDCTDGDLILTIKAAETEEVAQPKTNQKKKKVVLLFKETDKKMVLNATNRETIAKLVGSYDHVNQWPGTKIQLYKDPKVKFGTDAVGGLRVRNYKPEQETKIPCEGGYEGCKKYVDAAHAMTVEQMAAYTKNKYKRCLCSVCATKEAEKNGKA